MPQSWTAVTVTAEAELAESIGAFLLDQGAPGLVSEDVAEGVRITAHFHSDAPLVALESFCAQMQEWFPGSSPAQVSIAVTSDENWADNWKEHFPPLAVGQRLWVHPPWATDVPAGRIGIVIDPGMAFGTGQHASTRGCLTFLDRIVRADQSQRVLDIGTGSGVLAIAAAKLGARKVHAIDIDPDACRIAAENTAINRVADRIDVGTRIDDVNGPFDIVVANLFADQLVAMNALINSLLTPGGTAIGSGILTKEAEAVTSAWTAAKLIVGDTIVDGEWTTIIAHRT